MLRLLLMRRLRNKTLQVKENKMAKNKQNFDLQNLHELNAPIKLGIGALLILAILGLGYFLLFKDQLAEYDAAKAKEVELKESYANKSVQAASLENLKAELAALHTSFNQLLQQLPTDKEIPNLIQELNQAASTNNLRLGALSPLEPVNDGAIQRLPYKLAISGQYGQVAKFARDIGGLSRIITLSQLDMAKDDKTGQINLNAIANTYKARPVEELAAEQAKAASAADEGDQK